MATVNKDFKLKNGLIVEGANATVNGNQVLTGNASDQYIIDLIGGETLVTSVNSTQLEVVNGELSVKSGVFDAAGAADTAENNANDYTDAAIADEVTRANGAYDASGAAASAESAAIAAAQDYTDAEVADEVTNRNNAISNALTTAEDYADTAAGNAQSAAILSSNGYTDSAISSEVTRSNGYADEVSGNALDSANNYTDGEITTALTTAQGYANTAESNANSYTDGEISTLDTLAQGYANTAEANANAYTDNAVSGLAWKQSVNLLATSNVTVASSVVGLVIDGHDALTTSDTGYRLLLTGQSTDSENGIWETFAGDGTLYIRRAPDADAYTELVGAAVYVMEGTQFGSTSWVQGNHYLSTFAGQAWTQFSGQGSVTAGSGITVDGLEVSVNRTTVDTWYDALGAADTAEANANDYTDGEITTALTTAQGYATTAQGNAEDYADSLAVNYDAAGSAATAQGNAEDYADSVIATEVTNRNNAIATAKSEAISAAETYTDGLIADEIIDRNNAIDNAINALDTDDIEEGTTNFYFTDFRAKSAAAQLLTQAELVNITIDGTANGLVITAENGVADSTTDDLNEGEVNLYFTTQRALDAVDNAGITPMSVEINNYRKEEATQQYVNSVSTVNVHTLSGNYESVKYLVRIVGWDSGVKHSQISEILMTIDGNDNIAITEYGTIHTSTNPLASFSATLVNGRATLTATTAVSGCEVIAAATMLSWAD